MRANRLLILAASCAAAGAHLRAQQGENPGEVPPSPIAPTRPSPSVQGHSLAGFRYDSAYIGSSERDDYRELQLRGGFRFVAPALQLDVRGTNALVLFDLDEARAPLNRQHTGDLPHRDIESPAPRRRLSTDEIRARLDRSLQAIGRSEGLPIDRRTDQALALVHYLYFEGGVTVVREGVEVLRCDRLWISPLDDRIVVENAELRYESSSRKAATPPTAGTPASSPPPGNLLIVRGPKLVKQGGRWTGRDVTITPCTAGEPHAALGVAEIEIVERDGEFEIVTRGQTLQVGGTPVLPLPDAHIFTRSQSALPIRRVSGGYSQKEGVEAEVVFGLPWNESGGAVHQWLTGRPAEEFRGDWELGVGWIEKRGVPIRPRVTYEAAGVYRGYAEGIWLDDTGTNLREIQTRLDGSLIDTTSRGLVRSENRLFLGADTTLDLSAFYATDAAVLPEFYRGPYRDDEVPETSAYLHHGEGNRLFTFGTRYNLDDFSYRDNRALAQRFVEELPVVTYDVFAQPLGETPWGTPIVVDMATELGQRRSNYDDRAGVRLSDRTFRADQLIEVSAPFSLGELNLRPFVSGRGTWYDNDTAGDSQGRVAFTAGAQLGTRMSRTWSWSDSDGEHAVRHVIAPKISYLNRFRTDDRPGEFYVFDANDTLTEQELVRLEVRNLFQTMAKTPDGVVPRDFLYVDFAQDVWPDAARDNGGDTLGLFYYDVLVRPTFAWLPVDRLALAVYGDLDWHDGLRTFDSELQIGPLAGITWTANYREDSAVAGAVGLTANTSVFQRWDLYGSFQRDLESNDWLGYTFGLARNDHDWSILASASYNPFSDQTTFQIEFVPRFGGMNRGHRDMFGGEAMQVSNFATGY